MLWTRRATSREAGARNATSRPVRGLPSARGKALTRAALVSVLTTASLAAILAPPASGSSSITSDRASVTHLEQRIASQGVAAQSLVARLNIVQAQMDVIRAKIAVSRSHLAAEQRAESAAKAHLRATVVNAYVNAAAGSAQPLLGFAPGTSFQAEQQIYLGAAGGDLSTAIGALQYDEHQTLTTETALNTQQAAATQILNQLDAAQTSAQVAISADQAILSKVSSNLQKLVTEANLKRQEEADRAAEAKLAAAAAQQRATATGTPDPAPTANPAPGTYANPFRSVGGLVSERIDQGVDLGGFGPVYAIGNGVVISTYNGGWPGGTFISYRLTAGPAAGLIVYVAENIAPRVSIGQSVDSGTVIGVMYEGPTGIETGWATSAGDGVTMAASYGQYGGGNSTSFGVNFSHFLQSLGAPGGIQESSPAGGLPAGWPNW